ncbi:MAG: ROK family protein [Solirubrobacterales bacterium]|nr:ROK family protein [Solirubrobacterales bacterium]MBV9714147.1 ROK family protein [Solirubrobacterales bacterium]
MSELYGGVETGGTWCVCALATGPEDIREYEQFRTAAPEETLMRIIAFFRSHPGASAIGIGSFGPVDADLASPTWGHVTTTPKPGWQGTALAPVVRDALRVPVAFDTDVAAAALGEYRWGAGRGLGSLCYLTVGTGIGAGLVVAGEPVRGLVHPEVGHIRIPKLDSFAGVCPTHGDCWEGIASGPALAERWGRSPDELADEHPAWPLEAEYLALGILSIVLVASPERVIVGGGVMERPGLLARVGEKLRALNAGYLDTPMLGERVQDYLVAPELGDRAGVLGAIALAERTAGAAAPGAAAG